MEASKVNSARVFYAANWAVGFIFLAWVLWTKKFLEVINFPFYFVGYVVIIYAVSLVRDYIHRDSRVKGTSDNGLVSYIVFLLNTFLSAGILSPILFNTGIYLIVGSLTDGFIWAEPGAYDVFMMIACVLFIDFCRYVGHRIEHSSFSSMHLTGHIVHHSMVKMSLWRDRFSFIDLFFLSGFFQSLSLIFLFFMEPSHFLLSHAVFSILFFASGQGQHQADVKLKWLNKILITPDAHAVHHEDGRGITSNFSNGIFSFWDVVFGSYGEPSDVKDKDATYGSVGKEFYEADKGLLSDLYAQSVKPWVYYFRREHK